MLHGFGAIYLDLPGVVVHGFGATYLVVVHGFGSHVEWCPLVMPRDMGSVRVQQLTQPKVCEEG